MKQDKCNKQANYNGGAKLNRQISMAYGYLLII